MDRSLAGHKSERAPPATANGPDMNAADKKRKMINMVMFLANAIPRQLKIVKGRQTRNTILRPKSSEIGAASSGPKVKPKG